MQNVLSRVPSLAEASAAICVLDRTASGALAVNSAELEACANVIAAFESGQPVQPRSIETVKHLEGSSRCNPCS